MKMNSNPVISKELSDNLRTTLGRNVKVAFKCKVRMETKGDKTENKIMVFSTWRLYITSAKIPAKVELNFHYLDIQAVESRQRNQLCLHVGEKSYTFYTIKNEENVIDLTIYQLITSLKIIFPLTPIEHIIRKVDVTPQTRLQEVSNKNHENIEVGPCGGFSMQYACMCDYHGLPYRDEVAWDVDTIYSSHDARELCLQDFDHLEPRDLIPIISALEYNTWFTKFRASNTRLLAEAAEQILSVLRKSVCMEEIYLDNTGLRWEFVQRLSGALIVNANTAVHTIDFSNNLIEDKGAPHLVNALIKLPKGLKHLNLSKTGLSAKGVNMLANALAVNKFMASTLTYLNLADNTLKEEVNNLYNFLAQPNTITHLDLSGTDVALDLLFGALLRGCSQKLSHLNLCRNVFSHKKAKDVLVPTSFKQFFMTTVALRFLNLSSSRLPAEALKNLLLGLTCNEIATNVELDLSSNNFGTQGGQVMEHCLSEIKCLNSLDISDNNLDLDFIHVVNAIAKNKSIRRLSIGRNFANIKSKHMGGVMESLVQLIQDDESVIEHLSLADSKLKSDVFNVINALGSNQSLISIDISGNQIGDGGARLLAKALQINNRLKALFYDRNSISANGFFDLSYALQMNYTMRFIPFPIYDACIAMKTNPERTDAAMKRIENLLHRNVSPKKFNNSQAFRLQQGFLLNATQQSVDRLVVQSQDLIKTIASNSGDDHPEFLAQAEEYIKDADKSKHLLPRLHNVILQREEPSSSIELKLNHLADELHRVIQNHLQGSVNCMIKCAEDQCPTVLGNSKLCQELQKTCQEKGNFPMLTVQQSIIEQAGTDILNKVNELNFAVASYLSDQIIDEVIETLSKNYKALQSLNQNLGSSMNVTLRRSTESMSEKSDSPETPQFSNKRKSVNTRKLRPQSIVDTVDGVELESMPSLMLEDIREASEESSSQRLQHLAKARPKRQKTHAATRATVRTETIPEDEQNINVGLDTFFQKSEPSTPVITPTSEKVHENLKSNKSAEKSQKVSKAAAKEKTTEPEKKEKGGRLVHGLSSMFSRRSSDRLSKSKSTEAVEKTKDADTVEVNEGERESLSNSESNLRQPTAVPKVGVGNNILAEMKALQEKRFSQVKDVDKSLGTVSENKAPTSDGIGTKDPSKSSGIQSPSRPMSSPNVTSEGIDRQSPLPERMSPGSRISILSKPKPPPIAPKPRPRSMISPEMRKSDEFSPMSEQSSFDGSTSSTPEYSDKYEDSGVKGFSDSSTPPPAFSLPDLDLSKRKAASLPRTATPEMVSDSPARSRSFSNKELGNKNNEDASMQVKPENDNDEKSDSGYLVDDVVNV